MSEPRQIASSISTASGTLLSPRKTATCRGLAAPGWEKPRQGDSTKTRNAMPRADHDKRAITVSTNATHAVDPKPRGFLPERETRTTLPSKRAASASATTDYSDES